MEIIKRGELIALHRAIMLVKKSVTAAESEVIGSPYLASVAERVLHDLLMSNVEVDGGSYDEEMSRWLKMSDQLWVQDMFKRHVESISQWLKMTADDRRSFIVSMASPMILPKSQVEELLVFGDEYHRSTMNDRSDDET